MSIKIFAHRGLVAKNIKENTLEAFQNAYKNNFRAFEFDIWYLKNQLVLKHNRPNNLKNLTNLKDFFTTFQNKVEYWLDFKNLHLKNCDAAIKEVKKIIDDLKIKPQKLYFAPFINDLKKAENIYQTIHKYFGKDAQIIAVIEKLNPKDYNKFYQELKEANIYGLSIYHKNINLGFKNIFHDIKVFAWTVDDQKTLNFLEQARVENIASNKLIPTK